MAQKTALFFISACLFSSTGAWCADKEETTSPAALLSRAQAQEDIWVEGTPPTLMRAEIQVFGAKGASVQGSYALNWVSPSRWREEIRLGDYERIRVRDAKGYWQKSGLSYQPEIMFHLDAMLHLENVLKLGSKNTLGKVKSREKDGGRQNCTEVKWEKIVDRTLCFDEVTGALVSVGYLKGENHYPPEISRIEYQAFGAVSGKLVPYEIRALREESVLAVVRILEIANHTEEDETLFNPPANAEFWTQCDDRREPELVDVVRPQYPASARKNHEQGRVIVYAVVEAEGSLSHLAIIHRATPALESAAMEAIRRWHYKPAACGQTPIRVETSIPTDYWLVY